MANISDYLDWRGDITMEIDPFNEVDNLVLAELAYTDFGGIVPGLNQKGQWITIREAHESLLFYVFRRRDQAKNSTTKVAPFLIAQDGSICTFSKICGL